MNFKKKNSTFVGHFRPPGSGSGSTDPIESGSYPQPCYQVGHFKCGVTTNKVIHQKNFKSLRRLHKNIQTVLIEKTQSCADMYLRSAILDWASEISRSSSGSAASQSRTKSFNFPRHLRPPPLYAGQSPPAKIPCIFFRERKMDSDPVDQ